MESINFNDLNNKTFKFGIIGLGLIGGSLAKALREAFNSSIIVGFNRRKEPRILAIQDKVCDIVTDKIDNSFKDCDYIFLCTPVEYNLDYLKLLKPYAIGHTIITDAGSTKRSIHDAVCALEMEEHFIGGHPMAGSEKTGYEFSNAWLFRNAYYPITPTAKSPKDKVELLENIIKLIGARPVILDPREHDYAVAGISHLPHLIASSLTNMIKDKDSENCMMKKLAANGFKDTTRIAASSPDMWEQICMTNTENIVGLLDSYIASLNELKIHLNEKDGQYIHKMFEESRTYRNSFGNRLSGNPNDL